MRSALLVFLCAGAFAAPSDKLVPTTPVLFEQNAKQWSARGLGYAFRFESNGTALRLGDRTLRLKFENSNPSAPFAGLDQAAHPTNLFRGKTYQRIENYTRLRRTGVYPGIDVLYYSRNGELEYDFEIAPGADPSPIALHVEGADSTRVADNGDLIFSLGGKELTQRAPSIYQRLATGELATVAGSYRIGKDRMVRFELGAYDHSRALVIDPSIIYVAFLGGSFADIGIAVGHDAQGYIYIGGNTFSTDFPVGGLGYDESASGDEDCFLIKINPNSSDPSQVIAYSTYYGGTSDDILTAMKVSPAGIMYFTGNTNSTNFPVSTGAFSGVLATGTHAFVVELDSNQDGSYSQLYSSYFGGTVNTGGTASTDSGQGIFVSPAGLIYVTGSTTSTDFYIVGAFQGGLKGSYDGFVVEFDPTQGGSNSLLFSSFLGGSAQDWGNDIGVDSKGLIYVTGYTYSTDFPYTSSTAYSNYSGQGDAFLTVINSGSGTVVYSTFLGGPQGLDEGTRLVVNTAGTSVAIAGFTLSPEFPVTQNAYQPVMPAGSNLDASGNLQATNGFLAIFDMTKATAPHQGLVYSTYFGGFGGEVVYGLRADSQGYYYLSGYTLSQNLPVTSDAFNATSGGGGLDGFISVLNPSAPAASQLVFSSYITSDGTQIVYDVDLDNEDNIWITGVTTAGIFPAGYEQFPLSPSTGYAQNGKQISFIWGFTLPSQTSQARRAKAHKRP
jgi:hypothetical protein